VTLAGRRLTSWSAGWKSCRRQVAKVSSCSDIPCHRPSSIMRCLGEVERSTSEVCSNGRLMRLSNEEPVQRPTQRRGAMTGMDAPEVRLWAALGVGKAVSKSTLDTADGSVRSRKNESAGCGQHSRCSLSAFPPRRPPDARYCGALAAGDRRLRLGAKGSREGVWTDPAGPARLQSGCSPPGPQSRLAVVSRLTSPGRLDCDPSPSRLPLGMAGLQART
jgi:hypothetical protein